MQRGVTLYFIRHGETDWNRIQRYQGQTDIPLNDTGRAQAARNGGALLEVLGETKSSLDYVASPLQRTRETMQIVRRGLNLPPDDFRTDDRLKEQHFGHWEGLLWTELPSLDPQGFAARQADMWNWQPTGGENYATVRTRVMAWLDQIARDTVVVSHGNISRTLRQILLGIEPEAAPRLEVPQDKILRISAGAANWI